LPPLIGGVRHATGNYDAALLAAALVIGGVLGVVLARRIKANSQLHILRKQS